jgi:hypothetical protein
MRPVVRRHPLRRMSSTRANPMRPPGARFRTPCGPSRLATPTQVSQRRYLASARSSRSERYEHNCHPIVSFGHGGSLSSIWVGAVASILTVAALAFGVLGTFLASTPCVNLTPQVLYLTTRPLSTPSRISSSIAASTRTRCSRTPILLANVTYPHIDLPWPMH